MTKTDNNAAFKANLKEVKIDFKIKSKNDENGNVTEAKANTNSFLTGEQLQLVNNISNDYGLTYLVKRSGAGLVVEFSKDV